MMIMFSWARVLKIQHRYLEQNCILNSHGVKVRYIHPSYQARGVSPYCKSMMLVPSLKEGSQEQKGWTGWSCIIEGLDGCCGNLTIIALEHCSLKCISNFKEKLIKNG